MTPEGYKLYLWAGHSLHQGALSPIYIGYGCAASLAQARILAWNHLMTLLPSDLWRDNAEIKVLELSSLPILFYPAPEVPDANPDR